MLNNKSPMKLDGRKGRYTQFKDMYIVPQYSDIASRKEVDLGQDLNGEYIDIPVISANMDTVTNSEMAIAMHNAGGIGALHRFLSIEENVEEAKRVRKYTGSTKSFFVSIGVNDESKERAKKLYEVGATNFIIDIAHGHSLGMTKMITWLRKEFGSSIYIVAGNVATYEGAYHLFSSGADVVKVGIGPGAACSTKNVTGVTVPQCEAIYQGVLAKHMFQTDQGKNVKIIADGGIKEYGDIAKALALGADFVMCGRLFAQCFESPTIMQNGKKVYRGMASKDAMMKIKEEKNMPTPEGIVTTVDQNISTKDLLREIKGALQSAFSYSNSRTLQEFHKKAFYEFM